MNNLISTIKTKILRNKNTIIFVAFLVLLFSADNAFAEAMSQNTKDNWDTVIDIGNIIFALGGVLIGILTQFVGLFLQPGWTTGSVIGLDVHLKRLWVLVSNIIYFVFAFLLIVVAFMNIIGKGENTYQMKTALPHFIVGILIVPFSWFIVQFVLSISALLTVSALSLPWDMFGKGNTSFNAIEIPKSCTINVDKMMGGEKGSEKDKTAPAEKEANGDKSATTARSEMGFTCGTGRENKTSIGELMSSGDNLFSIMYVYSYGIMRIQDMDKLYVTQTQKGLATNLGSLAANVIFNGLFVIRFLILLVALTLAMFSRGVVLWLFTIFSPVFGLLYFFNGKAPAAMEGLSKLSFKDFLGLAMVPVYVGLALSFGLLFSFVATNGLSINQSGPTTSQTNTITGDKITIGGMELNIKGGALGSYKEMAEGGTAGNMAQQTAKGRAGFIRQLFIDLIAIAVLWMAVMAALGSSKITKSVVDPIAKFGTSIGQTAMKLPQYAPIPGMGGMSASSMSTLGSNISSSFESSRNRKGTDFYTKHFGEGDKLGQTAREVKAKLDTLTPQGLREEQLKILKETGGDLNKLLNNSDGLATTKEIAKRLKIDEKEYKDIKDSTGLAKLIKKMEEEADKVTGGQGIFKNKLGNDLNGLSEVQDAIKNEITNQDAPATKTQNSGGNSGIKADIIKEGEFRVENKAIININNGQFAGENDVAQIKQLYGDKKFTREAFKKELKNAFVITNDKELESLITQLEGGNFEFITEEKK